MIGVTTIRPAAEKSQRLIALRQGSEIGELPRASNAASRRMLPQPRYTIITAYSVISFWVPMSRCV